MRMIFDERVTTVAAETRRERKEITDMFSRLGKTLNRTAYYIACALLIAIAVSGTASAAAPPAAASADALWNTIAGLIGTWVTRLGAVVMFVGGVMFGLGWKNDDAEGKSRGISTLIAGAIVTGVAALTGTFFA